MRILVFGGDGMLGHQLIASLRRRHTVFTTYREGAGAYPYLNVEGTQLARFGLDVRRMEDFIDYMSQVRPEAVINAVGIVKQREDAKERVPSLEINALFPHRLAAACRLASARFIQISTDCVFSGKKGSYTEDDRPDAEDVYGTTKWMGEVTGKGCLTLRTSIIGLELKRKTGLVEWFLAQRGVVTGYRKAIYSGLTTLEMARAIEHYLVVEPELEGLWHLSSQPIDKCTLLTKLKDLLGRQDVQIEPDDTFHCDRSLVADRLMGQSSYHAPGWDSMLRELADQIINREKEP